MSAAKKRLFIGLAVLLLLLLSGYFTISYARGRAQIQEARELMAQGRDPNVPEEERRANWQKVRAMTEKMPRSERTELFAPMREKFRKDMHEKMTNFFALSPAEQKKQLDQDIVQSQQRDKEREKRRAEARAAAANAGNGAGGGPGAGNGAGGPGAGNGAGGPGAGGPNGGGPGGPRSDTDIMERRNDRLDRMTSEDRTMMFQYRAMINQRRQELGLPPSRGFFFGGGGGGPRIVGGGT